MRLMKNTSLSMTLDDSTIVAIGTPIGIGAISIVRLSGGNAYNIALSLTHRDVLKPRYAHLCYIYDTRQMPIDEALVLYFPAPHSYTTQDVCEVQCHGGLISAKIIVQLCIELGARLANAGEFTKRAFLGGRLDLAQIQAIAGLINSQNVHSSKIFARHLRGEIGSFVRRNRESLLEILALSEVNIDYSEEVEESYKEAMLAKLRCVENELRNVYETSLAKEGLISGYTLGIIGKPNVGKSSLLNALLMEERAIVSSIEGTTRDSIEENLYIDGALVRIIDTAGIRQSDDEVECKGIAKTKEIAERSDILLAVFDGSVPFDERDAEVLEILKNHNKYVLVVLNKIDMPSNFDIAILNEFCATYEKILSPSPLLASVQNGDTKNIRETLKDVISHNSDTQGVIVGSVYQIECLKSSLDSILQAYKVLETWHLELFSYNIQDALHSLSNLTHPYEHTELLDKLFSTFCLGK